jgi:hypothetical protein
MGLRRRRRPDGPVVIAEAKGACLVRLASGATMCECPFACVATEGVCVFEEPETAES